MSERDVVCLGVREPGATYTWSYVEGPPGPGEVRLETLYSGFSAGTELTFVKGTNPYLTSRWNGHAGLFEPGVAGQEFPVPFLGYMEVGRVLLSNADGYAPGDVVAGTWGHKSGHVANPDHDLLVPLPEDMDPLLGIFVGQMGPIAANGVLHADVELAGTPVTTLGQGLRHRRVLVIGGGTVGVLSALFARDAGADVLVAEPDAPRRERLSALGLPATPLEGVAERVKARWHHAGGARGADVVLQTRAHGEALATALRALRPQGCVVDLAFYQGGLPEVRLGEEFHHNALAIRCAQIGRTPRGTEALWDRERLAHETLALLERHGEALREHLVTHVVPVAEATGFIDRLARERLDFAQIVLDYTAARP